MNDLERIAPPRFPDLLMRTGPNWIAVVFLLLLGGVHLAIAVPAMLHGHWEGYLSLVFAIFFGIAAAVSGAFRREIGVQASRRQIRLRTGLRRWHYERFIPFEAVSAVKLTLDDVDSPGRIEIISLMEQIECPPTRVPRQEALLLALMLGVTLVKVSGDETEAVHADSHPT